MGPLSLSVAVAGITSLTTDLIEILNAYVGVKAAPEHAVNLLDQLSSLSDVLRKAVTFLRSNEAIESIAHFERPSVLCSIVETCQQKVMDLYKQLVAFRAPPDAAPTAQFYQQLEWPLSDNECKELLLWLRRYAQTLEFSLKISNCSLLCGTPTQVTSTLRENRRQTQKTIDTMNSMMGSVPDQLVELSEKLSGVLDCVLDMNEPTTGILLPASGAENVSLKLEGPTHELDNELETQSRTLLNWISPLEPQKRHQDICSRRSPHTGGWFLQRPEFTGWIENSNERILICYGAPGSGKSIMTSIVADHLRELNTGGPNQTDIVLCLYCDYRDRAEQSATNMIGALLKQIFIQTKSLGREIEEEIIDKLTQKMRIGANFELGDVKLLEVCLSFHRVFICIDALDECRPEHRSALLESLEKVLHLSGARLFVTGRTMKHTKRYLMPLSAHLGVSKIRIEANREDIQRFLRHEIDKDPYEVPMPEMFREELTERIAGSSQGIFLLPALQIQIILEQPTVAKRRSALRRLPTSLNEAYSAIIDRIRSQQDTGELAMQTLMFVSFARRLLKFDELRHALAVDSSSKTLDSEKLPSVRYILACCMGLVAADTGTSTIRLVHFTLQEYLNDFEEGVFFNVGHARLAGTCITYLGLSEISSMIPEGPEIGSFVKDWAWGDARPKGIPPLWEYAGAHWGDHFRVSKYASVHTPVGDLALDMLKTNSKPSAIILFKKPTVKIDFSYEGSLPGPLHVCSYFGLDDLLASLLTEDELALSVNERDYLGACPLTWAVQAGHEAAVQLLVQRSNVDADVRDNHKRTPLSWAAGNGYESMVWTLVEQDDVNSNSRDKSGRTPLSWAMGNGHESIVRFLLDRDDVYANGVDSQGWTPISWAAANNHESLVLLLLERDDVRINGTLLALAAGSGLESVVRLLVGRVDVNSKTGKERTPLSWAAQNGHESVVRFLVDQADTDVDNKERDKRTPLSWAAQNGHESVVRFLAEQGDVDADNKEDDGRTPLSWAAQNGHESIVRFLIERGGIDVNHKENSGLTPLSRAAKNGHCSVVRTLVEQDEVDVNNKCNDGRTPLLCAAANGRTSVVRFLAGLGNVDADSKDNHGRTPLWWAAGGGYISVVQLLAGRDGVDADAKDNHGQTPLSFAAERGRESVVRFLADRDDVDADRKDEDGRTPLSWAAQCGQESMVRLLVERDDVNVNSKDNDGWTPLLWARSLHRDSVVQFLIERDDVEVGVDEDGHTSP